MAVVGGEFPLFLTDAAALPPEQGEIREKRGFCNFSAPHISQSHTFVSYLFRIFIIYL